MTLIPSEDEQELARLTRTVLLEECDSAAVRAAWESETGRSDDLWRTLADVGLTGLLVSEGMGGLGLSFRAACVVLEQCGRSLVPEPLMETLVASRMIERYGTNRQREQWLPEIASGAVRIAVKAPQEHLIRDAHVADLVLWSDDDGSVGLVRPETLELEPVLVMDGSRRAFRSRSTRPHLEPLAASAALVGATGATATAALLVGVATELLERTVEYVSLRKQFGRYIGSFQAIKHGLAEGHVMLEVARPTVWAAATYLDRSGFADLASTQASASVTKIYANRSEQFINNVALQYHGGVGFTWEYDLHLWLKRGKSLEAQFGTTGWHRRYLARQLPQLWDDDYFEPEETFEFNGHPEPEKRA